MRSLRWFAMSAVTQNQPLRVEIKGFKTGHYLGEKTALFGPITAGSEGHVECLESEPADDDIQVSRSEETVSDSARSFRDYRIK